MVTSEPSSALQRKMNANRDGAPGAGRSAAAALRLAVARTASELFDLAVSVIGIRHVRADPDALANHISEEKLLMLLDGPPGQTGALIMDRALMVALIQQQTIGRLTNAQPDDRAYTATDAAMVAPLIDETLTRAARLAEVPADVLCLSGFRFGARVDSRRSALLALDADRFRVFDLTLELAGGQQQGTLCLILPEPEVQPDESADPEAAQNAPHLGHAAAQARADLTAVLSRIRVPLAELSRMQPGELLPLMQERLDRIELVTITGDKVGAGRLGQAGGLRALRLNESRPPMPGDRDGFATGFGAKPAELDDPMTVEGHLVDPDEIISGVTEPESEAEDDFASMSPEEAAVEISALAGLDPNEQDVLAESVD